MQLKNQRILFSMRAPRYGTLHLKHRQASDPQDKRHRLEIAYDDPILLPMSVFIKYSSVLIGCK